MPKIQCGRNCLLRRDYQHLILLCANNCLQDQNQGKKSKNKKKAKKKKKEVVQIIDKQRATNILIAKSRMKLDDSQIMTALKRLDSNVFDEEKCANLVKCIPNDEEKKELKRYKGPREVLGSCEKFMLKLLVIPRIQNRIELFLFKIRFPEQIQEIRTKIKYCEQAQFSIQNSKHFKDLLEIVLSLGNFLNQGTKKGNAHGFKLSDLNKLKDTKSHQRTTLLDFLITSIKTSERKEVANFVTDLEPIKDASRVEETVLASEISEIIVFRKRLRVEITSVEQEMTSRNVQSPQKSKNLSNGLMSPDVSSGFSMFKKRRESRKLSKQKLAAVKKKVESSEGWDDGGAKLDLFPMIMSKFLDQTEKLTTDAKNRMETIQKMHKNMLKLFGQDPKIALDELFGILNKFISTYVQADQDMINKKIEQEKRKKREKQKKEAAEARKLRKRKKKKGLRSGVSMQRPNNNNVQMDDLVEALGGQDPQKMLDMIRDRWSEQKTEKKSNMRRITKRRHSASMISLGSCLDFSDANETDDGILVDHSFMGKVRVGGTRMRSGSFIGSLSSRSTRPRTISRRSQNSFIEPITAQSAFSPLSLHRRSSVSQR